jgi:hypothetical protein
LHPLGKAASARAGISRCLKTTVKGEQRDESRYYTLAMALDTYEVLRQCIDATDELEFCFMVVIVRPQLHPDERRGSKL